MQRKNVSSSDIASIGYDLASTTLEIQFKSGGIYQYFNVGENIYMALMAASSHGKYFSNYIKDSYSFRKM